VLLPRFSGVGEAASRLALARVVVVAGVVPDGEATFGGRVFRRSGAGRVPYLGEAELTGQCSFGGAAL
jgi:hypothetical protein